MCLFFYFIVVLSIIGSAGADPVRNYFDELPSQEYWDGDWSIAHEEGTPVKDVRANQHISGWIDIIGFREMCTIGGDDYVNGSPRDFALVRRDAWHTGVNGKVVSFSSSCVVEDRDGVTTAIQYTSFCWKERVCKKVCGLVGCHIVCHWKSHNEYQTITYSVESPNTYTTRIHDIPVKVEVHNRSFQPTTCILIPKATDPSMKGVMDVQINYDGFNAARFDQVGFVVDNSRGTEFVEFDLCDDPTWTQDDDQTVISHFLCEVVVHEPEFNMSKLTIQMRTPYETRNVTNYNVSIINEKPIKLNVPLVKVFSLLCVSVLMILSAWKVITCTLSH